MNIEQLKEYLNIVLDMEKEIYAQTKAIAELKQECDKLGIAGTFFPPPAFTKEPPVLPATKEAKFGAGGIAKTAGLAFLFWPAAPVYAIGKKLIDSNEAKTENERAQAQYNAELAAYEKAKREHEEETARYEKNLAEDRARVQMELERKQGIGKTVEMLEEERARTKMNLQKIYDKEVVFPKYRNLSMIASIYEYFCAGRCTDLPSAYNTLEQEMLMNRVIVGIESVVARLEEIKQGQYMLFQAVVDGNRKTEQLLSIAHETADQMSLRFSQLNDRLSAQTDALNEIGQSARLAAYHTEQIEKQTSYMSHVDYLTGRSDGTLYFADTPPN